MGRTSKRLLMCVVLLALGLAGCETTEQREQRRQREKEQAALEARLKAELLVRIHEAEAEVWSSLHPMLLEAADYQEKETVAYLGAIFVSEGFYSEVLQEQAREEGYGPFVSVRAVLPGSPAERGGLRAKDQLLEVNGKRVPKGQQAAPFAAKRLKHWFLPDQENYLLVQRGGESLELTITPDSGVYYGVVIVASNAVDLHVDGDVIWLGFDLVEDIEKGEDLNYLMAYALAKNVMRHPKQKGKNAFLGQLVDMAAIMSGVNTGGLFGSMGGGAYSHAFEIEADLIALYLLAAADYPIESYPEFWDEILRRQNRKGELTAKDEERLAKIRQVIAAIEAKRAAGEPLFPEEYLQGDTSEIE